MTDKTEQADQKSFQKENNERNKPNSWRIQILNMEFLSVLPRATYLRMDCWVTMPQGPISYQVLKAGRSLVTPKPLQPIRGHWFTLDCVPNCSTSADITRFVPGKTMFPHSSPLIGLPFESASRMKYCRWSTFCSPGSPLNWVWR